MLRSLMVLAVVALAPGLGAQQPDAPESAPEAQAPLLPPLPEGQGERLGKIAGYLQSVTDAEYKGLLDKAAPAEGRRAGPLDSRAGALRTAYAGLAALEYHRAAEAAPAGAEKYVQAYQDSSRPSEVSAAVGAPQAEEAGWALDVFKFLGSAALDYFLEGGGVTVGRQVRSPEQRRLDKELADGEARLAVPGLAPEKAAELHYALGKAYEGRAAAVAPESDDERAAKKEARVAKLADLLKSVSDDEYGAALALSGAAAKGGAELASRGAALKSAYATMAALEYRQASHQAKDYSGDYERVVSGDAKSFVVDPKTLEETGWMTGLAPTQSCSGTHWSCAASVVQCAPGQKVEGGNCVGCPAGWSLSGTACQPGPLCPAPSTPNANCAGYAPSGRSCGFTCLAPVYMVKTGGLFGRMERRCPAGGMPYRDACSMPCQPPAVRGAPTSPVCTLQLACGAGSALVNGRCVSGPVCPGGKFVYGRCVKDGQCPAGAAADAQGDCLVRPQCPAGATVMGDACVMTCARGSARQGGVCAPQADYCPPGAKMIGGRCEGKGGALLACPTGFSRLANGLCRPVFSCPAGMTLTADRRCAVPGACPPGAAPSGAFCVVRPACAPGWSLVGQLCPKTGGTMTVKAGRSVGEPDPAEGLKDEMAGDELTAERAPGLHHDLGAAYEKLAAAVALPAPPKQPEELPPPQPVEQPAAEEPARSPEQAPKAEEPQGPTDEEKRAGQEKAMDEMGKSMSDEIRRRQAERKPKR